MTPELRKFALTTHVTVSIGWIGAVLVFLALAGVGLTSQDAHTVRGVYLVMEHAAWLTLVPLAFAALVTGLVMSLGTSWGLFRHYWVVFKLLITVFGTVVPCWGSTSLKASRRMVAARFSVEYLRLEGLARLRKEYGDF